MSNYVMKENEAFEKLLSADGKVILELGCGTAEITRAIATAGCDRTIVATDVDQIQIDKHIHIDDLPNVVFLSAGAQEIPFTDGHFDIACFFSSLHHVPAELMGDALREVARVLKPGGMAFICEPIFAGELNEIMRLFHDERKVRAAAYQTILSAVESGTFSWYDEVYFDSPIIYSSFEDFEQKILGVTHTNFVLSPETLRAVTERFSLSLQESGAQFQTPYRVNLLQKPNL
ncbi:MAG: ubiquinone/menaquinone biosynthesis C-methylase UbiE [Halieaceae bacterium]|jgi:ubiquinone/menaquinone biosynthesis C-methylase UbiE